MMRSMKYVFSIYPMHILYGIMCIVYVLQSYALSYAYETDDHERTHVTKVASDHEVSLHLPFIEETDSIYKIGLGISYIYDSRFGASLVSWSRTFDPVYEMQFVFSGYKVFFPFPDFDVLGMVGLSLLHGYTHIKSSQRNVRDYNYNIGMFLAINFGLLHYRRMRLFAFVHSALFPPGLAVIYGVTGRKNMVGLSLSYSTSLRRKMFWEVWR